MSARRAADNRTKSPEKKNYITWIKLSIQVYEPVRKEILRFHEYIFEHRLYHAWGPLGKTCTIATLCPSAPTETDVLALYAWQSLNRVSSSAHRRSIVLLITPVRWWTPYPETFRREGLQQHNVSWHTQLSSSRNIWLANISEGQEGVTCEYAI